MKFSPGAALLPFSVAMASAGCTSVTAPVDRTVARGGITARIEQVAGRRNKEARVALVLQRVPPGLKLLQATVSTGAGYCAGTYAIEQSRSGAPSESDPLRPGERIVLEFPKGAFEPLSAPAPRIDLVVESTKGTRRCIPLELTEGQDRLDWEINQRFTLGVDMAIEGYTSWQTPVDRLASFVPTLGVWLDRYRLELGAGIAGAGCTDEFCATDGSVKIDYTTVFPLHAGAQMVIWENGEWSAGLAARYRAVKLAADTRNGRESFWTHNPLLAPYIGVAPDSFGPNVPNSRFGLVALEVPIGYALAENGERSVTAGVNVRSFFTSF